MKVAIISPLPPEKPGEAIYTARLVEGLTKHSNIEIIAIGGLKSQPLNITGGRVETASIWNGRDLLYPLKLWRFIKKKGVPLVHVQFGPHGEVYGGKFGEVMLFLLILLKHTGVRTTVTSHSTWMIEDVKKRIAESPKISTFSILSTGIFKLYMKLLDWGSNTVQLSTVKLDSLLKQRFLKEFRFSSEKVLEIPHPCAKVTRRITRESAREQLGVVNKEIILIFGFIRRDKGIHLAMEALRRVRKIVPNVLLLVAGKPFDKDGEVYLQELKQLRDQYNLFNNVRFDSDYIPEDKISTYFSAASIILAPYTGSVGASGPLHSACGYGIPIVASNAGLHIGESLGGNVITFNPEDSESLSNKLTEILTNNDLAQKLGSGLMKYSELESWDTGAIRTISNYAKTMGLRESNAEEEGTV